MGRHGNRAPVGCCELGADGTPWRRPGDIKTSTVVILGPEIEDPALSQVNDSHVDSGKKFMIWLNKGDNLLRKAGLH